MTYLPFERRQTANGLQMGTGVKPVVAALIKTNREWIGEEMGHVDILKAVSRITSHTF